MRKQPTVGFFHVELHPLALTQHPKDAAAQRARAQKYLAAVIIADDDAGAGGRVIDLHNTLHGGESLTGRRPGFTVRPARPLAGCVRWEATVDILGRVTLTAADLKRVLRRYHDALIRHRETLNQLNVYPVPDGDTGTNMVLTVTSVIEATDGAESMDEVAEGLAHGSLMGARGNSGVILSQILRGLAETIGPCQGIGTVELVEALNRASAAAYAAVVRPVEGTILTVVREAAAAAGEAGAGAGVDLAACLERVYERAQLALLSTPEQLPVLKQAGVVDAGGAGLLLLLGAFLEEVTGGETGLPESVLAAAAARQVEPAQLGGAGDVASLRYEVMFFLEADDAAIPELKGSWSALGDSIVVVGGEGVYNCHIHTDDIGGAIEAGIRAGRPHQIRVTDLIEQSATTLVHRFEPLPEFERAEPGVLAVAAGDGVVAVFRELGAQAVVTGGQSLNPSTEELLTELEQMVAGTVIVLPNNKNIIPVAEQLDRLTDKSVVVVPTRSIPQGIAAMVSYTPGTPLAALAEAMRAGAGGVRSAEITRAVRPAETDAGTVDAGDFLVLVDGSIVAVRPSELEALRALVDHAVDDGAELMTIMYGAGYDPVALDAFVAELHVLRPALEVELVAGGQPLYPYLVSVE